MFFAVALSVLLSSSSAFAAPIRRQASEDAKTDALVFQFAGVLEQLETAFYSQALAKFKDEDFTAAGFGNVNIPKETFSTIAFDEQTHTSVIDSTLVSLGVEPIKGCAFNFDDALKDVATMAATARAIENVGVSAYLGGANLISNKELLVAAAGILTVEARHQTVLNILNQASSTPSPFDIALSPSQVLAIAGGFVSGCDIGIPANQALKITNEGTPVPGTKLTFESAGIPTDVDPSTLTCQMMTGGAAFALALPFDNCVVPNINGPVYIFIVNGTQPLLNSQVNQASNTILAGPALAFIDTVSETLGQVVKAAPSVVDSTTTISPVEATSQPQQNLVDPTPSSSAPAATSTGSGTAPTEAAANDPVTVLGWSEAKGESAASSSSYDY